MGRPNLSCSLADAHYRRLLRRAKTYNYQRKRAKKYPEAGRHRTNIRRARKQQACPVWVDKQVLKQIYADCPKGMHVDHIVPLRHDLVCGLHVPWNLQYLTPTQNAAKSNRFEVA